MISIKDYNYYKSLSPDKYPEELSEWFKRQTGETLHLDTPVTFNEKIQWMKLYDSTAEKARLADKYLVREWVIQQIGEQYVIPLIGVWDHFEDIDFSKFPNRFVLKCNHGCGYNIIVKDKAQFDYEDAKKRISRWLTTNYAYMFGLELHYKTIPPKIIAEQYIENLSDQVFDYRFYTFHGKVKGLWIDLDSGTKRHTRNIYDENFNLLPLHVNYKNIPMEVPQPPHYDLMYQFAEKLSSQFLHARVDFYDLKDQLYFGEITFTPQSGVAKWSDPTYNKLYGDYIHLPI